MSVHIIRRNALNRGELTTRPIVSADRQHGGGDLTHELAKSVSRDASRRVPGWGYRQRTPGRLGEALETPGRPRTWLHRGRAAGLSGSCSSAAALMPVGTLVDKIKSCRPEAPASAAIPGGPIRAPAPFPGTVSLYVSQEPPRPALLRQMADAVEQGREAREALPGALARRVGDASPCWRRSRPYRSERSCGFKARDARPQPRGGRRPGRHHRVGSLSSPPCRSRGRRSSRSAQATHCRSWTLPASSRWPAVRPGCTPGSGDGGHASRRGRRGGRGRLPA